LEVAGEEKKSVRGAREAKNDEERKICKEVEEGEEKRRSGGRRGEVAEER
jgi:hypothetical protein